MPSNVTLKAIGLQTQANQLDLSPGSLTTASNVIIRRDNVIEPRRGYKIYGTDLGTSSDRAKQLMTYKQRILRHFADDLEYDTGKLNSSGAEVFSAFNGSYSEPQTGRRIRFIESNSNFYFTTSQGIKKISAKTAADFTTSSNFITQAGGIKALDLTGRLNIELGDQSGFLPQDGAVAYRVMWGTRDANNNLIQGSPSQRAEVFNPLNNLIVQDFMNVLGALDNVCRSTSPSLISDGNYVLTLNLPITASATEVRTNLISLAAKLDNDILYADGVSAPLNVTDASINAGIATLSFTSGDPSTYFHNGSHISLSGFTPATGTLNGPQTISSLFSSFTTTGDTDSGSVEVTTYQTVADVAGSLNGQYFTFNSVNDVTEYYAWYKVSGVGTDPNIPNKTGIQVNIDTNDVELAVATKTADTINSFTTDFVASAGVFGPFTLITLTNSSIGSVTDGTAGTSGFTVTVTNQGVDANVITSVADTSGINVGSLISGTGIPANTYVTAIGVGTITISKNATATNASVDLGFAAGINFTTTATGSVSVITPTINSYEYENIVQPGVPSTPATDQQLVAIQTYLQDIIVQLQSEPSANSYTINDITIANPTQVTTTTPHYLTTADVITITGSDSTPSINGANTVTVVDIYSFTVPVNVTVVGTVGSFETISTPVISEASQTTFISTLDITTTATVSLTITIPENATTSNFFQVYRSDVAQATGVSILSTDVFPNDELKLVYEAFPTDDDITAGQVTVEDITPDAFRGANLYTNESTGEGILQANDLPPFAVDINRFKNVTFYANTRTRQRKSLSLLGVSNMIDDYNNGNIPTFTIANETGSNTYTFVVGVQEVTEIETVADSGGDLADTYFTINSANDITEYYVWYKVNGVGTDPAISGKTGVVVFLDTNDSANDVAEKTATTLAVHNADFIVTYDTDTITVTNTQEGYTTDANEETSGFTVTVTTSGAGEDAAQKQILLSNLVSPAQAVDETAKSMVHVINQDTDEIVYAFYLSGAQQVPGQILIEGRELTNDPFYIVANNSITGLSFNPDLSPENTFIDISVANPTVITTASPHNLTNLDSIVITNTDSTPPVNGLYTITYIDPTTFSIEVDVTVIGTTGSFRNSNTAIKSDNEELANRIYYSKYLQPEAVPIVNTIDVGAKDKAILRIFPLRDSLFVFKEDGLFRISGETTPFNLSLFDSSVVLLAPDSLDVSNNLLYGWTTQGVVSVSETGASNPPISRPIDSELLKLATTQYENFTSATWGIGYESDNSYTVYTVQATDDTYAQIGYRYSTITNTWTTFDKSATCGVINSVDDKQYLGAGDVNSLEKERKEFSRYDYADREITKTLTSSNYFGDELKLSTVSDISVGDVVTQDQYLTVYEYNQILKKMDTDATLDHDYFSSLEASAGDELRTKVDALITKVANDSTRLAQSGATSSADYLVYESIGTSGTITGNSADDPTVITCASHGLQTGRIITIAGSDSSPTINGTYAVTVINANTFSIPVSVTVPGTAGTFTVENTNFLDIEASYNGLLTLMNNDPGVNYSNYMLIENVTLIETIVTDVDNNTKKITVDKILDFISGPLTIFKSITSTITYGPQTMGDALSFKQFREATVMFENKAFTSASLSFATDLLPMLQSVPVLGTGNGIFGLGNNFGYNFFGGGSHSAPFRTYIPRDAQRCRYLICQFEHTGAREKFSIYGISLTGEVYSTKAYR